MSDKDGGPAFPRPGYDGQLTATACDSQQGMTLWDYFAAAALSSISAPGVSEFGWSDVVLAEEAAGIADAMLAERTKRGIGA